MEVRDINIRDLVEAGAHFGHKVSRWNPKMKPYIYAKKNGVHIIDIKKTVEGLAVARHVIGRLAAMQKHILFVGTKRHAKTTVQEEAQRCQMPFVTEKWTAGLLTNFAVFSQKIEKLDQLEKTIAGEQFKNIAKKEQLRLERARDRLIKSFGGLRIMTQLPAALFLVDPTYEKIAVSEANKLGILTVALIDTDGNPENVDIVVPGNDDSFKVIKIVAAHVADAVIAGRSSLVGASKNGN